MQYAIKDFKNEGDQKLIGFLITADKNALAIDKRIPLEDGKSDEQYVAEAFELCKAEIADWQASFAIVGKTFDPATGTLA